MNLQTYIESGILELYILNLLDESERLMVQSMVLKNPQLKMEIQEIERALENYAFEYAVEPSVGLKEKIEQKLVTLAADNAIQDKLILIDEYSDLQSWLDSVTRRFPEALHAENFCELIGQESGLKQMLVVSTFDIEEESHEQEYESFLILRGKCRCTVDGNIFFLEAGGFTQIPLKVNHKVEVIDGPVMAVVQYTAAV
ncbi:cupin domain-containing protein [Pedobacter foliorum]|uniref:cupin domain-containing protein n=1 Tax=Pedobacter foliorum TaxID=2739058 RepID=UPI0015650F8E|nr:cupin domain-containing protein [Pedobacter foliorum]